MNEEKINEPLKEEKITLNLEDVTLDFDTLIDKKKKQVIKKNKKAKEKSFDKFIDENKLIIDDYKLKEVDDLEDLLNNDDLIEDEKYDDFEDL